jgi:hypothetical protein
MEFFQSLTIAQCLFIRNEVLGTCQQREAWQSAVCEAAGMEPTRRTVTVSNSTTDAAPQPPTIRLDSATPGFKSLRVDMIYMKKDQRAIGHGRLDMSPKVSFEDFRTLVAGQFGDRAWSRYHWSMKIDPPVWGDNTWGDLITKENWPEVRDRWLRCDRVLCLGSEKFPWYDKGDLPRFIPTPFYY